MKTFTEHPEALARYRGLHSRDGRRFTVTAARATKPSEAVLTLAEVSDRTTAEGLKGTELYVPRDVLPATERDEFYHADLIGLRAEDVEDRVIGLVKAIHNYGAGDVIRDRAAGRRLGCCSHSPKKRCPSIEIDKGRIVIACRATTTPRASTAWNEIGPRRS